MSRTCDLDSGSDLTVTIISMVIYYHYANKNKKNALMYQELLPREGALVFNAINFCWSPAVTPF